MGLGKLNDDMHHKYHPYDSWVGWAISAIEMGLFLYFTFGIRTTKRDMNARVAAFVTALQVYGSLYFLGFPVLLILSKLIAHYNRYKLIMIGTNVMRVMAVLCMTSLFTSKSGGYAEISYKNQTFMDRSKCE
jgi:hypothetical protein